MKIAKLKKVTSIIVLALAICSCDSNNSDIDLNQLDNLKAFIGDKDGKPGTRTLSFKDDIVYGSEIKIKGDYPRESFGEVLSTEGKYILILDNPKRKYGYAGMGLEIPKMGLVRDESILLESQAARYIETAQKAMSEQGIRSNTSEYTKRNLNGREVITATIDVDLLESVESPSYIRNLILVSLNNRVIPKNLAMYRKQVAENLMVSMTFWQNDSKDKTYVWVGAYSKEDKEFIKNKYKGLMTGASIKSVK